MDAVVEEAKHIMLSAGYLAAVASGPLVSAIVHRPPAYLDPGSGSFLLQLLVAGILGGLFAMRAFWGRLRDKITGKKDSDQDEVDGE